MDEGNKAAADDFYFESIIPAILPLIKARSGHYPRYDAVISLIGFTPETTVLACRLLRPEHLAVLHTRETEPFLEIVRKHCGISISHFYHESFLHDDEHTNDIFASFDKLISRFPSQMHLGIEMTGGKKTMGVQLATAVAVLKHVSGRSVDVIYIDYDEYLPQYRKPVPESSRLLILPQLAETAVSFFRDSANKYPNARELIVNPVFTGRGFPIGIR